MNARPLRSVTVHGALAIVAAFAVYFPPHATSCVALLWSAIYLVPADLCASAELRACANASHDVRADVAEVMDATGVSMPLEIVRFC